MDLLQYLVDHDFLLHIGEGNELDDVARRLNIPKSSWYDITKSLSQSNLIMVRSKNRWYASGILVWAVYEIQLTKKGLEHLTRFSPD